MKDGGFTRFLRKLTDRLERTAFVVFLLTDIAIVSFIVIFLTQFDRPEPPQGSATLLLDDRQAVHRNHSILMI